MPEASISILQPRSRGHLPHKPAYVYVLKDPRDGIVRYVGVTTCRLARRFSGHLYHANQGRPTYISRWFRTVLEAGVLPEMQVIETVPAGIGWIDAEQKWIRHYRDAGHALTNATDGGDGTHCLVMTEEHREAIGAAHRGRKHTPQAVANMKAACAGRRPSSDALKKAHAATRKETSSPETKEKQRLINLGKKRPWLDSDPRLRPVVVDGVRYRSGTDAAKALGLSKSAVLTRIKVGVAFYATDTPHERVNERATKKNDAISSAEPYRRSCEKAVEVDGVVFHSVSAAARYFGRSNAAIIGRIHRGRGSYIQT